MAEAIISSVVEMIGNLLIKEAKFLHGVKDQAEQLHAELKRLRPLLKDADKRQSEAETLREWISQTRTLAYRAEDLVEHYAFKVQSPDLESSRGTRRIIKRCIGLLDDGLTRHQVGSDIKALQSEISDLRECFEHYGIRAIMENEGGSSSGQQPQLRRTYSLVPVQEYLVGVEDQVKELAEKLTGENYEVVSIFGVGGLGKTTLAWQVYHHPDVRRYFKHFSWISISQKWKRRKLLLDITIKFMPAKRDWILNLSDEELASQLFKFNNNKKSLLVLDDIWSLNAWYCIQDAFPISVKGNKVLLTTRIIDVATGIAGRTFFHQPRFLSNEESWELLQRKSLRQRSITLRQRSIRDWKKVDKLEELGNEILEHCGGLPLAVLVFGGILTKVQSLREWENVYRYVISYLRERRYIREDRQRVKDILELSFNDLPYQLKPCFLYLSRYPEDVKIETESLYQIWMAEGMISMDDRIGEETMMDVAECYLGELVERYMVFVEMEEVTSVRKFKSCWLHDLMRELCLHKAKEENFLHAINYQVRKDMELVESSSIARSHRLAIYLDNEDETNYVPIVKGKSHHIRSFTSCSKHASDVKEIMKIVMADFKMLRVLVIECEKYSKIHLPSAIGKLIHLRYLRLGLGLELSDSLTQMNFKLFIPSSIGNLKHLQTFDFAKCGGTSIANVIWKLKCLKHLYLCRHLHEKVSLDGLDNLEILENFNSRYIDVKVISSLTKLRSLTATVYGKQEDVEEFINGVNKLNYLRYLSLEIKDCDFCSKKGSTLLREVFLCSPLTHLTIIGSEISKLPEYEVGFWPNLHELSLWETKIEADSMRTLEKLPNLRRLFLYHDSFMGEEMIFHETGFPQLRFLHLELLYNLNNWWIEAGAMPNLSTLNIYVCEKLKMIPYELGFVTTLKELNIFDMPESFTKRLQVKDGQKGEDFNKVCHVPSIKII